MILPAFHNDSQSNRVYHMVEDSLVEVILAPVEPNLKSENMTPFLVNDSELLH